MKALSHKSIKSFPIYSPETGGYEQTKIVILFDRKRFIIKFKPNVWRYKAEPPKG